MRTRTKSALVIILTCLVGAGAVAFLYALYFLRHDNGAWWESVLVRRTQKLRVRLLCKADHRALLDACRRLSGQVTAGALNPGTYDVRIGRRSSVAHSFPRPILALKPAHVTIDIDGRVWIDISSGRLGRFGVLAYPPGEAPEPASHGVNRKLVDGLWYYDDGYNNSPEYDKKIRAILEECGRVRVGEDANSANSAENRPGVNSEIPGTLE